MAYGIDILAVVLLLASIINHGSCTILMNKCCEGDCSCHMPCLSAVLDCTNLNISLSVESSCPDNIYYAQYCYPNKSYCMDITGCSNTPTCYLTPNITGDRLTGHNTVNILSGTDECSLTFMPYLCACLGRPDIIKVETGVDNISVILKAPATPYQNPDGVYIRMNVMYLKVNYRVYLVSKTRRKTRSISSEHIRNGKFEFYFQRLEPSTEYQLDMIPYLDGVRNEGGTRSITVKTKAETQDVQVQLPVVNVVPVMVTIVILILIPTVIIMVIWFAKKSSQKLQGIDINQSRTLTRARTRKVGPMAAQEPEEFDELEDSPHITANPTNSWYDSLSNSQTMRYTVDVPQQTTPDSFPFEISTIEREHKMEIQQPEENEDENIEDSTYTPSYQPSSNYLSHDMMQPLIGRNPTAYEHDENDEAVCNFERDNSLDENSMNGNVSSAREEEIPHLQGTVHSSLDNEKIEDTGNGCSTNSLESNQLNTNFHKSDQQLSPKNNSSNKEKKGQSEGYCKIAFN